MLRLDTEVRKSGIDPSLYELIKIRASQINGCAYCIDLHTTDARKAGESEQRIYALSAWRESPLFSDSERAALGLIEEITLVSERFVPDSVWNEAASYFDAQELAAIVFAAVTINSWNRIAVATRKVR
jgi:AhpD family alkylhydroperoxidase